MIVHPDRGTHAMLRLAVRVLWQPATTALSLRYRLEGDLRRLLLPAATTPGRAERLWQHTCLEAFVRPAGGAGYAEFNFSPSGQWAAWWFTARRAGRRDLELARMPGFELTPHDQGVELAVTLDLGPMCTAAPGHSLDLGLAAVIEDVDRSLGYWALRHGAGPPDFHDPESFTLRLGPAGGVAGAT